MTKAEQLAHLKQHKKFLLETYRVLKESAREVNNKKRECSFSLGATNAQIEKLEKELTEVNDEHNGETGILENAETTVIRLLR